MSARITAVSSERYWIAQIYRCWFKKKEQSFGACMGILERQSTKLQNELHCWSFSATEKESCISVPLSSFYRIVSYQACATNVLVVQKSEIFFKRAVSEQIISHFITGICLVWFLRASVWWNNMAWFYY